MITGIEMTKAEQQRDARVMKAEIVQYPGGNRPEPMPIDPAGGGKRSPRKGQRGGTKKSGVCALQ